MSHSSVFLRIRDYILVEFIYSSEVISPTTFKKYMNTNNKHVYLANAFSDKNLTNNVETLLSVDSDSGYMAIVDVNEGFYYPNSNQNIVPVQLPQSLGLKYDSVKIHIRNGYNFQDNQGFYSDFYIKDLAGNKVSLISQAVLKGDISSIKYNNTPLRLSEATFDKYVEYKVLSVAEIFDDSTQNRSYFNANVMPINMMATNPIIYLDFSFITNVDSSQGYVKFYLNGVDSLAIPAYDGYGKLQPSIEEKESYFQYQAMWDGKSIEDFITVMNSRAGANYHIEHEITIYEQRGYDFYEAQRLTSVQKFNYDQPMKFRPVLSNLVDGSMQIEYVMRFYNSADNTSIAKRAFLNSLNVNQYLEEPMRINVPIQSVHKVYNKVFKKSITTDNKKSLKIPTNIVPIYYSNVAMSVGDQNFILEIVPFDNVYSLYMNQEVNGQITPISLDISVQYQLVFVLDSGKKVRVSENDINGKLNGVLNFKINESLATQILASQNEGRFYINSVNDIVETNLSVGNWQLKGIKDNSVIDEILTEEVIAEEQTPIITEEIITVTPVLTAPDSPTIGSLDSFQVAVNPNDVVSIGNIPYRTRFPLGKIESVKRTDFMISEPIKVSIDSLATGMPISSTKAVVTSDKISKLSTINKVFKKFKQ